MRLRLPLPPGPSRLPFIGNVFKMPAVSEWEAYSRWGKEYKTDILHFGGMGQSIIVLESLEACIEILDKRSSRYSGRHAVDGPSFLFLLRFRVSDLPDVGCRRVHRRLFNEVFHTKALMSLYPRMTESTHVFLRKMLDSGPHSVEAELRHMAGSLILDITYGIQTASDNDPYLATGEAAAHTMATAGTTGAYWVNVVPMLKHLPEWVPGAQFKRDARAWRKVTHAFLENPYAAVKERMAIATGDATDSFASLALRRAESSGDLAAQEDLIKGTAASMVLGGSDSTVCNVLNFVLAMLQNPEVQDRAYAELESVLERDQLPLHSDANRLPYLAAVVKEVLRHMPVTPITPHSYTGDVADTYRGYAIPRGSVVIANIWSIVHDERLYPDPYAFKPERFLRSDGQLNPDVQDPMGIIFGFGRRVCPGSAMAYQSLWIVAASVLRVYKICHARRPDGSVMEVKPEYESSMVRMPHPFPCQFIPRSAALARVVRETGVDHGRS
ncbi:cytochrome P450 [Schizophyllum fasciatum]